MANKQSPSQQRTIKRVMHEYKHGELKGGKGRHPKAKSRKQAIAIALHEAGASRDQKASQRRRA